MFLLLERGFWSLGQSIKQLLYVWLAYTTKTICQTRSLLAPLCLIDIPLPSTPCIVLLCTIICFLCIPVCPFVQWVMRVRTVTLRVHQTEPLNSHPHIQLLDWFHVAYAQACIALGTAYWPHLDTIPTWPCLVACHNILHFASVCLGMDQIPTGDGHSHTTQVHAHT